MKDYVGGDYRYYEIHARWNGLGRDTHVRPTCLANWPGQDSAYHIITNGGGNHILGTHRGGILSPSRAAQ